MNLSFRTLNSNAVRHAQRAYEYKGITYLPSWNEPGMYVGPGRPEQRLCYRDTTLMAAGATPVVCWLWKRFWTEEL